MTPGRPRQVVLYGWLQALRRLDCRAGFAHMSHVLPAERGRKLTKIGPSKSQAQARNAAGMIEQSAGPPPKERILLCGLAANGRAAPPHPRTNQRTGDPHRSGTGTARRGTTHTVAGDRIAGAALTLLLYLLTTEPGEGFHGQENEDI